MQISFHSHLYLMIRQQIYWACTCARYVPNEVCLFLQIPLVLAEVTEQQETKQNQIPYLHKAYILVTDDKYSACMSHQLL